MNRQIVRSIGNNRVVIETPEDPYDLVGIAVDYQEATALVFPSGVLTRMQWDVPIIASNYVTTGAAWKWTAISTALYQFIAQTTFTLTGGITYKISTVVYKNGVIYKGCAGVYSPVSSSAQTIGLTTIIPCAEGDTLWVECVVTSSDASDTMVTATGAVNFVNILRLWKTVQQALDIASNILPPPDGGGGGGHSHG